METPKFLAVHFDGDYLEHAAFVNSEKEGAQLTCHIAPGDHWDYVLIPIETAAVADELLAGCQATTSIVGISDIAIARAKCEAAIAKANN